MGGGGMVSLFSIVDDFGLVVEMMLIFLLELIMQTLFFLSRGVF